MKKDLNHIVGKSFVRKTLDVDGKTFENCRFNHCTFTYSGGNPPSLTGCSFDGCNWQFGDAAARTLGLFSALYGGGFDELVEATFHQIRKGSAFATVPRVAEDASEKPAERTSIFGLKPPRILKISKKNK